MTLGAARVIYTIQDMSLYVDQLLRGYIVAIVQCERGPLWEPTPVASWSEYERLFGRTYSGSIDPLTLKVGLQQGAKFVVIRIANCTDQSDPSTCTALRSSVTLQDQGGTPTSGYAESAAGPFQIVLAEGGKVTGTEVGPFTFGAGTSDAILLQVGTGSDQPVTLSGSSQTAQDVADQINADTSGLTALATADGRVKLQANTATDSLTVKAVANDAYSVLGFMEETYDATPGTDSLVVSVDSGGDQEFTLTAGTRTAAQIVADMSALTGATASASNGKVKITSASTGASSTVQVQASSTADTPLGFDNDVHAGHEGAPQDTLTFEAANPGAWGDGLKVQVYDGDLYPGTRFDVRVSYAYQGGLNEYFDNLTMDEDDDRYAVNYINERSRLVEVTDENSSNPAPTNQPNYSSVGVALTGGSDGDPLADADYIGDEEAQTGIYAADKTDMSIDLMIPGTQSITVLQALVAYCENRGEYVAYSSTPAGYDPSDTLKWRMGESPYSHEAFNSHRLALFFGRPLVYDARHDTRKFVPNMGHLAACISKTDTDYDYHYAPVGPRRGVVDFVEGLDFNLYDYRGYQDEFAEHGVNSLIITRDKGIEGAVFWEQYTTQRAASALRDLNVVRFLTAMRKVLVPLLRMFLQEPNHPETWREMHRTIEPAFQLWKAKYSIYDYKLQSDRDAWFDGGELKNAVLNDGLSIDQGIYSIRALVQPTRAIRYIDFTVGVMRTGEAFSEYVEMKELPGWARR